MKKNKNKCKGKTLCIHNKIKLHCYKCCQDDVCKHNQNKYECKDCNITKIKVCTHNQNKYECKDCNITKFEVCTHQKQKAFCIECRGSQICIHEKRKAYCKECKGSQICIHDKLKTNCKECKGSQVCIHNKIKQNCLECGGSRYCIHKIYKGMCRICDDKLLCKNKLCKITGMTKYNDYCVRCYINLNDDNIRETNYLTKEINVSNFILTNFNQYKWSLNLRIKSIKRRPDLLLELDDRILIIEIDENQHQWYDKDYEKNRISDFLNYFSTKPIIFIYFNPDEYINMTGTKIKSCWYYDSNNLLYINDIDIWNIRLNRLKETITYWINNKIKDKYNICKLYFNKYDDECEHINKINEYTETDNEDDNQIISSFDDFDKLIDESKNILPQIINDCTDLKWLYYLQELDDYINEYNKLPNYNDSPILYKFIKDQELEITNFNYWDNYTQKYKYLF